jgi:hypothetical protein
MVQGATDHKESVFDRLSNKQNFTGIYKARFESGPGINGAAGENHVCDLSDITRPNLRRKSSGMKTGKGWEDVNSHGNSSTSHHGVKDELTSPKKSPSNKKLSTTDKAAVFSRLSDPKSFTGASKKKFEDMKEHHDHLSHESKKRVNA